jgi:hypothetical protein
VNGSLGLHPQQLGRRQDRLRFAVNFLDRLGNDGFRRLVEQVETTRLACIRANRAFRSS